MIKWNQSKQIRWSVDYSTRINMKGHIPPHITLMWNKWAWMCHILMWMPNATSHKFLRRATRPEFFIYRLLCSLFYWDTDGGFVSGICATQDTTQSMWQSFNGGNLIREPPRRFLRRPRPHTAPNVKPLSCLDGVARWERNSWQAAHSPPSL